MNIQAKKAFLRLRAWLPWALPLAIITIAANGPLTCLSVWGTLRIPETASNESLQNALIMQLAVFLATLAIPKVVIYFVGPRQKVKRLLWNSLVYLVLPVVAWLFINTELPLRLAWTLIALAAWLEAVPILVEPRLSPETKARLGID